MVRENKKCGTTILPTAGWWRSATIPIRRSPGQGSAIFFHIRRGVNRPTAGCTTMAEANLVRMITWLRAAAASLLCPAAGRRYNEKWGQWHLPEGVTKKISEIVLVIAHRILCASFTTLIPMRKRPNPDSESNIRRIDTKAKRRKQTHGFQVHFFAEKHGDQNVQRLRLRRQRGARRAARKFKKSAIANFSLPEQEERFTRA